MTHDRSAAELLFAGTGEMAQRLRSIDWSQTALGAVETWLQSLRSTLSIYLNSRFPIAIYWGADCLLLYNDAWRPIVGDKHPWAIALTAYAGEYDQRQAIAAGFQQHLSKPVDPERLVSVVRTILDNLS